MWKMSSKESFFPDRGYHFFLFLYLCHSPAACFSWVLFLKLKVVHFVLSFWLVCVMLRSYMLIIFQYFWISSQIDPDVTLCYRCMQTGIGLKLVQTKTAWAHTQLDFPLAYWIWVVKYKAKCFGWKNTLKVLKLTKLMTQISTFRLIYEKNKIFILISSLLRG